MTTYEILIYFAAPALGYLLASIPFALLIGKARGVDIRTTGSKNIGATNLARTLGKKYFWPAFLLDAAKGFFPVLMVTLLAQKGYHVAVDPLPPVELQSHYAALRTSFPAWVPLLTAVACVLGHNFPIYLKFKGGKGVATSFGAVGLGFWPLFTFAGVGAGLTFVFVLMVYRYISLASILGVLGFVAFVAILGNTPSRYNPAFNPAYTPGDLHSLIGVAALFALLIIFRHKANIVRLLKGTEPQIGQRERDKANLK